MMTRLRPAQAHRRYLLLLGLRWFPTAGAVVLAIAAPLYLPARRAKGAGRWRVASQWAGHADIDHSVDVAGVLGRP